VPRLIISDHTAELIRLQTLPLAAASVVAQLGGDIQSSPEHQMKGSPEIAGP
jgi:hypothetical protein